MANDTPSPQVLDAIEAAIAARDGSRRGSETTFTCPAHPDKHPSSDFNHDKNTWLCRSCGAGGGWIDLARRLGIDPFPKAPKSIAPAGTRYYTVYDADGFPLATKVREDSGTGEKSMHWEHNGKRGLPEGISPTDLLYGGIPQDTILSDTKSLFLVEGERAAQALIDVGYPAFGTTSGAQGVPSDVALSALLAHPVAIWADADDPGRNAAEAIALRLHALGNHDIRMVDWAEAPEKGDAADYCALHGGDLSHLTIKHWQPPEPPYRSASELMSLVLPPPRYAVPGLVAEGLNILAGRPKAGKSWWALQAGLAIASGGVAFNAIPVVEGDVLYLALEDTWRRLQSRIGILMGTRLAPEKLALAVRSERFDEGGLVATDAWLTEHPDARLVIVDTFQRVRPLRGTKGTDTYGEDYAHSNMLKELADKHRVAIVAIHHTRKATGDDPLESISGTNGLAGAADAVLVLKHERGDTEGKLFITGRDVSEREIDIEFHRAFKWRITTPYKSEEKEEWATQREF